MEQWFREWFKGWHQYILFPLSSMTENPHTRIPTAWGRLLCNTAKSLTRWLETACERALPINIQLSSKSFFVNFSSVLLCVVLSCARLNALRSSDAYMRQSTTRHCHQSIIRAKPFSQPMLNYCQLDPWAHIFNENLIEIHTVSLRKSI